MERDYREDFEDLTKAYEELSDMYDMAQLHIEKLEAARPPTQVEFEDLKGRFALMREANISMRKALDDMSVEMLLLKQGVSNV